MPTIHPIIIRPIHCIREQMPKCWESSRTNVLLSLFKVLPDLEYKMYSILLPGGNAKFTAKGVSRRHVLKHLKHEDYLHTLKTMGLSFLKYRTIRSYKHIFKTIEMNRTCLPPTTINATFFTMEYTSLPMATSE